MTAEHQQVFVLRIACPPGAAGLHALRALLKVLLRRHGFRALDVREEHAPAASDVNTAPAATAQRPADHFAPRGDDDARL
jgi:hypothetical protein